MVETTNLWLYRGDSIPDSAGNARGSTKGKTFADHFCGNGLMAKFADGGNPSEIGKGHWRITYKADPFHCKKLIHDHLLHGQLFEEQTGELEELMKAHANHIAAQYAEIDQTDHVYDLIDVVEYVNNQITSNQAIDLVKRTLERAERDSEYLVFPLDQMPNGKGYSSRLQMHAQLSVHQWYKTK